ncbi:biotin/lipoyl-binding protein, partial [bacterium]|nr:biotin/lipoyl-binding protein [bacterium]
MWRRIGCIGLVVVVLAVAGAIIYKQATGGGGSAFRAGKQNKEEKGNFEAARIDDLKIVVEATGVTEPITDVDVKSEATGRITEFYVEEGNTVKVGDLICKLDQSNQLLAVQQREIAKERARLSYEEAKKATGKSRQSSLEAALASAQAGLDSAREAYDTALATVSRIEELHAKGYATDQELENAR